MLQHFIKVAIRNLLKYRGQTLVSVAGLAVGFACFAMATLWIRYEMTYDSFHANADRLYCINLSGKSEHFVWICPQPLAGYLKSTFPEIATAAAIVPSYGMTEIEIDDVTNSAEILGIDSSFLKMFDVKIVEGSKDFLFPESNSLAITREKAIQLFGNESPIGKKVKFKFGQSEHTVCAVVAGLSKHSNYPFDFLRSLPSRPEWNRSHEYTVVEILPGVDVEAFGKKLYEHEIRQEHTRISKIRLVPLTTVHYKDQATVRDVKFRHVLIFALSGSLLIICTLFNCLTLFVSRFGMRRKELALRTVYGASKRSLFAMLSTEFLLSMVTALLLGLFLIQLVIEHFGAVSGMRLRLSSIHLESAAYIASIIIIALAAFILTLALFRRRTLSANIHGGKKIFRKTSIIVQLIVSIVFAFCTTIILKQMYHLHNIDLGFAFDNRGAVHFYTTFDNVSAMNDKIRQIPEIEETVAGYFPLLPIMSSASYSFKAWDDKPQGAKGFTLNKMNISEAFARYYELKLIEGEMIDETFTETDAMINESAMKRFGWNTAVGKSFGKYKVRGVLKDISNQSPTASAQPCYYIAPETWTSDDGVYKSDELPCILLRYRKGSWKTCREKITKIVEAEFPGVGTAFYNAREAYGNYMKSENALLAILTLISIICIVVCIFGFVSMVSLTCEERRKEIAIRKINGATMKDILDIFFKEHLTLLAVGAAIAFPAGYIIMKRWLEQYVIQTEISAWVYVAILFALILAIVLCVGGKVWRTSRENPIDAIK
jgi:hypothetical protein